MTTFKLRPYQEEVKQEIYEAWGTGNQNVLAVLPTGSGKTVLFAQLTEENPGASCVIAHRQELVSQISKALARNGVRHRIIGPSSLIKWIISDHMREFGRSFYDPSNPVAVAGVDTLIRRQSSLSSWLPTVTQWVMDEGHHILADNKWGKAAAMFPNARGLAVTATPERADGKGLGRDAEGLIDHMVVGPSLRWMIDEGYLTDCKIYAPPFLPGAANVRSISFATGLGWSAVDN